MDNSHQLENTVEVVHTTNYRVFLFVQCILNNNEVVTVVCDINQLTLISNNNYYWVSMFLCYWMFEYTYTIQVTKKAYKWATFSVTYRTAIHCCCKHKHESHKQCQYGSHNRHESPIKRNCHLSCKWTVSTQIKTRNNWFFLFSFLSIKHFFYSKVLFICLKKAISCIYVTDLSNNYYYSFTYPCLIKKIWSSQKMHENHHICPWEAMSKICGAQL